MNVTKCHFMPPDGNKFPIFAKLGCTSFEQNLPAQIRPRKKMTFRNSARNIYNSNYNFRLPIYKFSGFIYLIYNFRRPETPSTIYMFLPIASTMYNENKCQIYNVQFDLTPPSNMPCLKFKRGHVHSDHTNIRKGFPYH